MAQIPSAPWPQAEFELPTSEPKEPAEVIGPAGPDRYTKRGTPEFDNQPPRFWLEQNSSFSHKTEGPDGEEVRISFRKRRKGKNKGQWNGFIYRTGSRPGEDHDTLAAAYAGTCKTFDLAEAINRVRGQLEERQ